MNCYRKQSRQRGFSLIEVLVVLVIITLLIGIVAPQMLGSADKARIDSVRAEFRQIELALDMYKLDNFDYPTTEQGLRALVEKPSLDPVPRNWKTDGYLKSLPKDPWGNEYRYLSPGEHGRYDIYSLGSDNAPGGIEQAADLGSWQEPGDENEK